MRTLSPWLRYYDSSIIVIFGRFLRILVQEKNASSGDGSLIRSVNRDLIKRRIASQLLINSPVHDFRWSLIRRSSRLNFDKQAGSAVYTENMRAVFDDNRKWYRMKTTLFPKYNPRYWKIASEYKIKSINSIIVNSANNCNLQYCT